MSFNHELGMDVSGANATERPQFLNTTEASGFTDGADEVLPVEQAISLTAARDGVTWAFEEVTATPIITDAPDVELQTDHVAVVVPETVEAIVEKPKYTSRAATDADIDMLVSIDMKSFSKVYAGYDQTPEELRADLTEKFRGRLEKLGGRWIRIAERDGEPVGFTVACPTSKAPESFESWEKTTDNGTLETTFDPKGDYIYITSLSMLDGAGEIARNMLFAHMLSEAIKGGYKSAYFESRLPGLRTWLKRESAQRGVTVDDLSEVDKAEMADTYFNLKVTKNGKELPYDYLMRIYAQAGCKFVKLVSDAYADEPSMNYGAVGVFDVPVPKAILKNRVARNVVGTGVGLLARFQWVVKKLF